MAEVTDVDIVSGVPTGGTGTVPTLSKTNTLVGAVIEAAPASDTASSGLNGRLQRIAQRLTSLIALVPASLGSKADAASLAVTQSTEDKAVLAAVNTNLGTSADAASATGSLSAKLRAIATATGSTALDKGVGTGGVSTLRVAVDSSQIQATVAHDAVDSGDPLKVGGKATSAEPAAVASGDRANFITDLVGKLITLPYANPENFVSGATASMTATTSTSLIAAPGAGLRNYITSVVVSNSHATVGTDVHLQDGSGGTVLMVIPAAAVYGGATINLPVPLRQPTANTALFCVNATTGAATRVSAVGYKGA